jgi:hypothetical protein
VFLSRGSAGCAQGGDSRVGWLNRLVDFHEIWYGGNAIQGDLEALIFNPIASIVLILLRFKAVR